MTVSATSSVLMNVLKPVHVDRSLSMVHVNQVGSYINYKVCVVLYHLVMGQRRLVTLLNYYRTHIPDDVSTY